MFFTYELPFVQQTCFPCTKGPAADIRYRKQVSDVRTRTKQSYGSGYENIRERTCRTLYDGFVIGHFGKLGDRNFFKGPNKNEPEWT